MNRNELLKIIKELTEGDFNQLIFSLDVPNGSIPAPTKTKIERAIDLLRWCESPTGCGLAKVETELKNMGAIQSNSPVNNNPTPSTPANNPTPQPTPTTLDSTSQGLTTVKIFLASSSELKSDRDNFEQFIYRETKNKYIKEGIFLELVMWEDFIDAMSQTRLQDEYNKAIAECDIFVSLFYTKVGKYTKEEFSKALETFKANDKPKIYTYFKELEIKVDKRKRNDLNSLWDFEEELSKLGHFPTYYPNIDRLKKHFSDQLNKILPKIVGE